MDYLFVDREGDFKLTNDSARWGYLFVYYRNLEVAQALMELVRVRGWKHSTAEFYPAIKPDIKSNYALRSSDKLVGSAPDIKRYFDDAESLLFYIELLASGH